MRIEWENDGQMRYLIGEYTLWQCLTVCELEATGSHGLSGSMIYLETMVIFQSCVKLPEDMHPYS